jgi:hypothetical protein
MQSPQLGADLRFEVAGRQPQRPLNEVSDPRFGLKARRIWIFAALTIEITLSVQRARKEIIRQEPCAGSPHCRAQIGFDLARG